MIPMEGSDKLSIGPSMRFQGSGSTSSVTLPPLFRITKNENHFENLVLKTRRILHNNNKAITIIIFLSDSNTTDLHASTASG